MFKKIISSIISMAIITSLNSYVLPHNASAEATSTNPPVTGTPTDEGAALPADTEKEKFLDINSNQWFYSYVNKIKGLSLLSNGTPLLQPYDSTTLAEIYTLLQAQDNEIASTSEAIQKAITDGFINIAWDINKPATREDLYNAVGMYYDIKTDKKLYEDTPNIYANGILEKNIIAPLAQQGKFLFSPKRLATRAEAIVLIEKTRQFIVNGRETEANDQKPLNLPILIYHELTEEAGKLANSGGLYVSPEKFKQNIMAFQQAGYTAVTFEEVKAYCDGYMAAPEKPYVISFDDGYKGNYLHAFKIAKELNIKFVVSVIAESISRFSSYQDAYSQNLHLTESDIWEMHSSGLVEFQSHTYNLHKDFGVNSFGSGMTPFRNESETEYWSRLQNDMQRSAGVIRYLTGYTPCVLTYPMGMYNSLVDNVANRNGYIFTLTITEGISNLQDGTTKLKRINVHNSKSSNELLETILKYSPSES